MTSDLSAVGRAGTILLTTYRRDGTPVDTPATLLHGEQAPAHRMGRPVQLAGSVPSSRSCRNRLVTLLAGC